MCREHWVLPFRRSGLSGDTGLGELSAHEQPAGVRKRKPGRDRDRGRWGDARSERLRDLRPRDLHGTGHVGELRAGGLRAWDRWRRSPSGHSEGRARAGLRV